MSDDKKLTHCGVCGDELTEKTGRTLVALLRPDLLMKYLPKPVLDKISALEDDPANGLPDDLMEEIARHSNMVVCDAHLHEFATPEQIAQLREPGTDILLTAPDS